MNVDSINFLFPFLMMFAIFIALFLLLRELIMWYWKINKRIELAERNNILLEKILDKFDNQILSTKGQTKNLKSNIKNKISEETDLNNPKELEKLLNTFDKK